MESNKNLLTTSYQDKLDEQNEEGMTPLMIACSKGEAELTEKLVKLGAEINADNKGYTPLCYAVNSGDYETVRRLVLLGADISPRIYQDPITQKPEIISCLLLAIKKWQEWPSFQNLPPVSILLWHGAGIACQGLADCLGSSFDDYHDGLLDKFVFIGSDAKGAPGLSRGIFTLEDFISGLAKKAIKIDRDGLQRTTDYLLNNHENGLYPLADELLKTIKQIRSSCYFYANTSLLNTCLNFFNSAKGHGLLKELYQQHQAQTEIFPLFGQGTVLPKYLEEKLIPPEADEEYFFDLNKNNLL